MLGQNGFGDDCPGTARLSEANNGCDEVDEYANTLRPNDLSFSNSVEPRQLLGSTCGSSLGLCVKGDQVINQSIRTLGLAEVRLCPSLTHRTLSGLVTVS